MAKCILDLDIKTACVTWDEFKQLLTTLQYGDVVRVMVLMLAYTGCRVTELDRMTVDGLAGNTIYWKTGKLQKGYRKETLPDAYINELRFYRANNRTNDLSLFGVSSGSFCRYFNKARSLVGGAWLDRSLTVCSNKPAYQYRLLLKHFRKTFQTICFKHYYDKYDDAMVALEWVSKRLRHSNHHITAYHYIQNLDVIDVEKWKNHFFSEKPTYEAQKKLLEF